MMPEINGIEATELIRNLPDGRGKNIPIIALTANVAAGVKESFLESGMNDFISKPIDPKDINRVLIKWLPIEKVLCSINTEEKEQPYLVIDNSDDIIDTVKGLKNASGNMKFYIRLASDFISKHSTDFKQISEAIAVGDRKLAHRLAHTIKSTSALVGAKKLSKLALEIENKLASDKCNPTEMQLIEFDDLLKRVIGELVRIVNSQMPISIASQIENEGKVTKILDKEEVASFIKILEPLLASGNTDCFNFVDEINEKLSYIGPESKILIEQLHAFDFKDALNTLHFLKNCLYLM
jgi:CheY-like chemotaxis protein